VSAGMDNGNDGSRSRTFSFASLTGVLNAVGTVWIFLLMVLINADIFGREALNAPIRGVTELVSLSIVGIVFLQLAHTLWAGRLTRSDALLDHLRRTHPRLGHALKALYNLVGAVLFAIILYASTPYFLTAWRIGEYVGAVGDFTAPVWPIKLIILIGCAATAIQFLLLAWRELRLSMNSRIGSAP
jgi:TRAP-type mannitol/chloroaromatic compound transport system permease small subunit